MTLKELATVRSTWLRSHWKYEMIYFKDFNFKVLENNVIYRYRKGRGSHNSVNDLIIGFDTETSRKTDGSDNNHICAWTLSFRLFHINIATLYGTKPSEAIECFRKLREVLPGDDIIVYVHNLAYDWVFMRRYLMNAFGEPRKQLNTKSHNPINIVFNNGYIFKDSLCLAQRKLEKWAIDMQVEHQKAVGCWDYEKLRNQGETFSDDELHYIENDTLALVECIDAMCISLNKELYALPYTATGIVREDIRHIGGENQAKNLFKRICMDYETYQLALNCFHGGYTHANREVIGEKLEGFIQCYDFASSYPFQMLSGKFPMGRFYKTDNMTIEEILSNSEDTAYMFELVLIRPELQRYDIPMPALQFSKCLRCINPIIDNGRILQADYVEICLTEIDLEVIAEQYIFERALCCNVHTCHKDYLPRWLTDYIDDLFHQKTLLKSSPDRIAYNRSKGKINSCYGVHVQKSIRDDIKEDYKTGEYVITEQDDKKEYEKYLKSPQNILPYQWGVYVTSLAFRALFRLGKCCEYWIYSDTDSCYGVGWDEEKLKAYNKSCMDALLANGYGPVNAYDPKIEGNRDYWLGIAELDGEYREFKTLGAKRYCCRDWKTGKLKITVAGVPKAGVKCLNNDINNFCKGFIFDGEQTGKLGHFYYMVEKEYIDKDGNETADSIDLQPCNYLLDDITRVDFEKLFSNEIGVTLYE